MNTYKLTVEAAAQELLELVANELGQSISERRSDVESIIKSTVDAALEIHTDKVYPGLTAEIERLRQKEKK